MRQDRVHRRGGLALHVIDELWPTYGTMLSTHAHYVAASGVIEKAEANVQSAQIAYNALAKEQDRRIVAEQAERHRRNRGIAPASCVRWPDPVTTARTRSTATTDASAQ